MSHNGLHEKDKTSILPPAEVKDKGAGGEVRWGNRADDPLLLVGNHFGCIGILEFHYTINIMDRKKQLFCLSV